MTRWIVRLALFLLAVVSLDTRDATAQQRTPRQRNRIQRTVRDTTDTIQQDAGRRVGAGPQAAGKVITPMAEQCGGDLNPCKPQPSIYLTLPTVLATDQTGLQYVGSLQNQAVDPNAWGFVSGFTCSTSNPQLSCSVTQAPTYVYPASAESFTLTVTTRGMGPFTLSLTATMTNEGGSAFHTKNYQLAVRGSSFILFATPDGGTGTVIADDTLRASVDSLHELLTATVRTWVDGVERTASTTVGSATIRLATAPLSLTRGDHTWRVYACVDGSRCDDMTATFYYDLPPGPSPDSSQVVANAGGFPMEDLLPPSLGSLGGGWLTGGLPLPGEEELGCPRYPGAPEIRVTTPVSYVRQFGATIYVNGSPVVFPDGMIFRAEEMTEAPLRISTLTIDHLPTDTLATCSQWTFLSPSQYYYHAGESDHAESRWRSYPYGDRDFSGSAPGTVAPSGAGAASSSARPVSGPQFLPSAGAIDTTSYKVTLNGGLIYPADDYGASPALRLYKESMTKIAGTFRLPVGHPGLNVGGWNELITSIADESGNRTAVRSRFLVNAALGATGITTRTLARDLTRRSMGECAAFGAVQCDETFVTQLVPGFVSRDKDRSLHLVYRSGSQRQRLTLPVRLQYGENLTRPDSMVTFAKVGGLLTGPTLRFAGTKGTPGGPGAWPLSPAAREDRMVGAELDAETGGLVTRQVAVTVREFTSGVAVDRVLNQNVVQIHLTDTTATRFGVGWQLAEYSRLLAGSFGATVVRVWALGDGSFLTFTKSGSNWVAPGGVNAKLWEIVADSVPFRLTPPDGSVLAYYADGRPAWVQDQLGNRTRFVHSGTRLTEIVDPNNSKYLFSYNANGQVSLIRLSSGATIRNVASLVYSAGGQLLRFQHYLTATAIDTTAYSYTTSGTSAYLASVTPPARDEQLAVTDFAYDTLGWVPKMIKRPLFRGVRDSMLYRSAWRLAVPQSYQGRKTGLAPYAAVRTEYYRGGMMDVSGRVTEFKGDAFGNPIWVRRVSPGSNVLQPDGSTGPAQGDEIRVITRDSYGRVTEILSGVGTTAGRERVRMHYSSVYQMVDSIWRTSRAYPAPTGPDSLDLETFTFDSVSLGSAGGLAAGSDGRCYRTLTSKDPLGNVASSVQYMSTGRQLCLPWKITGYGASNVTTFAYAGGLTAGARPSSVTDPLGLVTAATYDATTWNTASVTTPSAGTSTIGYNAFGEAVTSTSGDTAVTIIARDYTGRDTASRTGLGPVTKKFYGRDGAVDRVAIYAGSAGEGILTTTGTPQVTRSFYNILGLVDSTVGPGRLPGQGGSGIFGRVQRVRYTRDLQPDTTWVGNGAYTTNVYDWAGRTIAAIQSPVTLTTAFADDSTRTQLSFNAGAQANIHLSPGQRTETWYDGRGRVRRTRSLDGRLGRVSEHRYGYTAGGALAVDSLVLADSIQLIRRFTYDRLGRRLVSGDTLRKLGGAGSVSGDTAGRQVYTYNTTTQLLESVAGYGAGSGTAYGAVNWSYDVGGREILRTVQLNGSTSRLRTVTGYTSTGQLDSIRTTWGTGAGGDPLWYRFKQGGYNSAGDLTSYDEAVNINGATTESAVVDLQYSSDHMRRLAQSTRTVAGSWTQYNWSYDAFNNRLAQLATSSAGSTCAASDTTTFAADNRLVRSGPAVVNSNCSLVHRYQYDYAGNRVIAVDTMQGGGSPSWQRSIMTYTAAGQLYFSITPATFPTYEATWTWYDGSGVRAVSKEGAMTGGFPLPDTTITGPWTYYIYDGGQLALTASRAGNNWSVGKRQLSGGIDRPLVLRTGTGPVALLTDRQGTFQTAITSAGGWDQTFAVTAANLFGARDGATRGTGASSASTGFTGASTGGGSGTGFVYLRNRWYDPQSGRFLTQDPIGLAGGVNLYAYAGNNPVSYSDPFGLCVGNDITYDICGNVISSVDNGTGSDRHFLQHDGQTYRLDYGLTAGSTPYSFQSSVSGTEQTAVALANTQMPGGKPSYTGRLSIGMHSFPGGDLDFKQNLRDRSLWALGDGTVAHKHAVGNMAWGYYASNAGVALDKALSGASAQGASVGGEDPLDQRMIRRGYELAKP